MEELMVIMAVYSTQYLPFHLLVKTYQLLYSS